MTTPDPESDALEFVREEMVEEDAAALAEEAAPSSDDSGNPDPEQPWGGLSAEELQRRAGGIW